ncbi:SDR family oxidoreductase [Planotetraspora mira]|uniref:SDR family NAD(P)-dependent oxidoreductase n=1 Tax=Planotetraspora mira TaxID=58121 RepID=A0A8J3TUE8_9ACTN|nr:SDR family oxidoreductase [Planotetraspora mira]GII32372.1 hypothetical protein Pmi06nite_58140 [Planotetraspora mira]
MSDFFQTAVVTGASRGFGRAIATALVAMGTGVVGIARDEQALRAVRDEHGEGFTPVAADATDEALAQDVIREYRPSLLVLNAGVTPHMAPLHEQTWETFSRNWHTDTRHVFTWTRAALREPLTPATGLGSVAVAGYAARQGLDPDVFVEGLQPILTADQVAKAVVELAGDPGGAPEHLVSGAGLRPIS